MGRQKKVKPEVQKDEVEEVVVAKTSPRGINTFKFPTKDEINVLISELDDRMDELGSDPSSVAKVLTENEVVGERNEDNKCPVANFLKKKCKSSSKYHLSVQFDKIMVLEHMAGQHICTVPLSKGVQKFVKDWDAGKYNKLEKKS